MKEKIRRFCDYYKMGLRYTPKKIAWLMLGLWTYAFVLNTIRHQYAWMVIDVLFAMEHIYTLTWDRR
jgi:hypothetical protein